MLITDGAGHSMLIDFDWCGIEGVDTYPLRLNRAIPWPDGVQASCHIKKAHDLALLKGLWEILKLDNGMALLYQSL